MSAQAGVLVRNGCAVNLEVVAQMKKGLSIQAPDGLQYYSSDQIWMAYGANPITLESVFERQPLQSDGEWVLTWDGRLDNRGQLIRDVGRVGGGRVTDTEIVGSCLDQWSQDCMSRLEGDWALAAWRAANSTLYLARDYVGTCPLYYCTHDEMLLWSSELESLHLVMAQLRGTALQLSEEWVASYLSMHVSAEMTPFVGIHAVPPGSFVISTTESIRTVEYWRPDPTYRVHYQDDREYEEHFRHLLREAVQCRLRSRGPVWAHLSGGLDSSAIVCMADDVVRAGHPQTHIETVSATFEQSPESDERRFIEAVEKSRGIPGKHFSDVRYMPLSLPFHDRRVGTPDFADVFSWRERAISQSMRSSGAVVQFSGEGGDELLGNIGDGIPNLLDHLHFGQYRGFLHSLEEWALALRKSRYDLLGQVLADILPNAIAKYVSGDKSIEQRASMLDSEFMDRLKFRSHCVIRSREGRPLWIPSAGSRVGALKRVIARLSRTALRRMGAIHVTYPYLHRPLVSFLLAIPADQLARPGERRSLMRRSLRSILPEQIVSRRGKRSPDAALYRAMNQQWTELQPYLHNTGSAMLGILDEQKLQSAASRVVHGAFPVSIFLNALCLEMWIRQNADLIGLQSSLPLSPDGNELTSFSCHGDMSTSSKRKEVKRHVPEA